MKKIILVLIALVSCFILPTMAADNSSAKPAFAEEIAASNPFGISPSELQIVSYYQGASISWIQYNLIRTQTFLTVYVENDLDSLETITPSFGSTQGSSGDFFDASLYGNTNNNQTDSTVIGVTVDGSNDSALVVLMGTMGPNVTPAALDTLITNKTTFIQQGLDVDEAGKYIFPYWGFKFVGIEIANGTVSVYILNVRL